MAEQDWFDTGEIKSRDLAPNHYCSGPARGMGNGTAHRYGEKPYSARMSDLDDLTAELRSDRARNSSNGGQLDVDVSIGPNQELRPAGIPSGEEMGRVKLTVNIPERDMATLRTIAAKRDMTLTDVVRRAIAMEQFIEEVESQGGKLLVEQPDHSVRQLLLR